MVIAFKLIMVYDLHRVMSIVTQHLAETEKNAKMMFKFLNLSLVFFYYLLHYMDTRASVAYIINEQRRRNRAKTNLKYKWNKKVYKLLRKQENNVNTSYIFETYQFVVKAVENINKNLN